MKKIICLTSILFTIFTFSYAQAPYAFKYQAVVCYTNSQPIVSQPVGFQITILQGGTEGDAVYVETHLVSTNSNGMVNLEIGNGNSIGFLSDIHWEDGPYFLKIDVDTAGGTNYVFMGTSQLLSVPYALYSESASTLAQNPLVSSLPVVATLSVDSIYVGDVLSGGLVITDGGASISSRGIILGYSPNPTIDDNIAMFPSGSGAGDFLDTISLYSFNNGPIYFRAFATNSAGTNYGSNVIFENNYFGNDLLTWSDSIMLTFPTQVSWATYNGNLIGAFENNIIGVSFSYTDGMIARIIPTANCAGWVFIEDGELLLNYSQLESLYSAGTVITEYDLPVDGNYEILTFISKVDNHYMLIKYVNGLSYLGNNNDGWVIIFQYKQ